MKTVLITGGAGGIGNALCTSFAEAGYRVAVHFHTQKKQAEQLAEQLHKRFNVQTLAIYADIAAPHSVRHLFDIIDDTFGGTDILVNNAGIAQQKLFTDITDADWRTMLDTNLSGTFYCCREALCRTMLPLHNGAILNISSMWGQVGASCEVHYSAAKAGIIGMTKALAKEVGLSGVRVNCIAPGIVMTDMMASFDQETILELKNDTPLNLLGTPQDIANAAVFLCSDRAKFITGQVLGVNGGFII
ncbi:MAG: 3-oxoacyl-ACP reductase FabG [Ruminococcus sp.]|nr:3-oxoacyl-ACP reductase FabG [Ruminococcus sp.]